ncbi:hypothetical protein [Propionivibrio dicarboxylicus]|uniref:Uncharacterized protein n=1 Tax=Propionivibrio dicarboxylicus TaxID=83767 RepID=A0A1G7VE00_9RHOO|nr:hypothetical protein [Propionivibrio dicarboxylicus]SDG57170.1 hypothetical protein SAMN05660652_00151 [Propionivibrio dicarboxylicus]
MIAKILAVAVLLAAFSTPADELKLAIDAWTTGAPRPGIVVCYNEALSAALPDRRRSRDRH